MPSPLAAISAAWNSLSARAVSRAKIAASLAANSFKACSRSTAASRVNRAALEAAVVGGPAAAAAVRWATSRAARAICQPSPCCSCEETGAGAGPEEEDEGPPVEPTAPVPEPLRVAPESPCPLREG